MVSHHPSKFGGQRYCGGGDITFLVVEEQFADIGHTTFAIPSRFSVKKKKTKSRWRLSGLRSASTTRLTENQNKEKMILLQIASSRTFS